MGIIKLTKSRKAWIIIDDFGNPYSVPCSALAALHAGTHTSKSGFVELTRLPMPARLDRFRMSPLAGKNWEKILPDDEGWVPPQCPHNIISENEEDEGLSAIGQKKRETQAPIEDQKIDW